MPRCGGRVLCYLTRRMSRAWAVYILMFAVAGSGLWVIFTVGAAVRAPDDLSGDWTVRWETAPPPGSGGNVMRVAQSGRFFTVRFGDHDAAPVSLMLQRGWRGARDGRTLSMLLKGGPWSLAMTGDIPLGGDARIPAARVDLAGPSRHSGMARRLKPEEAAQSDHASSARPARRPAETVHAR